MDVWVLGYLGLGVVAGLLTAQSRFRLGELGHPAVWVFMCACVWPLVLCALAYERWRRSRR